MNIELTRKTRLLTANKVCREDITIIPKLQEKTATEKGVITPDSGYVGLSKVTVDVSGTDGTIEGGLGNPGTPKFGRLKYVKKNSLGDFLYYIDTYGSKNTAQTIGANMSSGESALSSIEFVMKAIYGNNFEFLPSNPLVRDVADGNTYELYDCTDITALWYKVGQGYASLDAMYIPPCVCRVFLFDSTNKKIISEEYDVQEQELSQVYKEGADLSCGVYRKLNVGCNYGSMWLVGSEFIYNKVNVKFSGTVNNLQYSTDKETSASVTDGREMSDIEHITIKNNNSDIAVKIGTSQGASDIATINPRCEACLFPDTDVTYYIS